MRLLLMSAFFFTSLSTIAQQTDTPKRQQIVKLMEMTGTRKLLESMKVNMKEAYKKNIPDVDATFMDNYFNELSTEGLINLIIPIYDKHFTEADIKGLVAFYETPAGKKMVEKLPLIMQESMTAGQQWGISIGQDLQEKLKEKKSQ